MMKYRGSRWDTGPGRLCGVKIDSSRRRSDAVCTVGGTHTGPLPDETPTLHRSRLSGVGAACRTRPAVAELRERERRAKVPDEIPEVSTLPARCLSRCGEPAMRRSVRPPADASAARSADPRRTRPFAPGSACRAARTARRPRRAGGAWPPVRPWP